MFQNLLQRSDENLNIECAYGNSKGKSQSLKDFFLCENVNKEKETI